MSSTSIPSACPMSLGQSSATRPATLFFNPRDVQFNRNPYPHYKRLREEDPVHRSNFGVWYLGRYEHVRGILRDKRFSVRDIPGQLRKKNELLTTKCIASDQPPNLDALISHTQHWLPFMEPPVHTRLRRLISGAFEKRTVVAMAPYIASTAHELLKKALHKGEMDVMADFANVLPLRVICNLVGIPLEDVPKLVPWIHWIGRVFDPFLSLGEYGEINSASERFIGYLKELIKVRNHAPRDDLLSALIDAQDHAEQLTEAELIAAVIVSFGAGEETVSTMIGNAVLAMSHHPDETQTLRDRLDLLPAAADEFLRYDAPLQMTSRVALEDVELCGKHIRKGEQVFAVLASANRDPEQFERPDDLIFDRPSNPHLSFVVGHHACVGASLARVEIQEALRALLTTLPRIKVTASQIDYRAHTVLRSPICVPIAFRASASLRAAALPVAPALPSERGIQ